MLRTDQSLSHYERNRLRRNRFASPCRVQPFIRFRFDVDLRLADFHRFGESHFHFGNMRRHLRAFGQDSRVDVGDLEPALLEQAADVAQKDEARGAGPPRVAVGEMRADVAERGRAEQRVGYRVRQAVTVGMAEQSALVRDFDPAEDQLTTFDQTVDVISYAYSKLAHISYAVCHISYEIWHTAYEI